MKKRMISCIIATMLALQGAMPVTAELDGDMDVLVEENTTEEDDVSLSMHTEEESTIDEDIEYVEEANTDEEGILYNDSIIIEAEPLEEEQIPETEELDSFPEEFIPEELITEELIPEELITENLAISGEELVEESEATENNELVEEENDSESEDIAAVGATSGTCGTNLKWTLNNGTLTISGNGGMTNYSSGGAPWYNSRSSITKVIVNSGITTIGNYSFYQCSNLQSAEIANTVYQIGSAAFNGCFKSLVSVKIPDSVTSIGQYAFGNCEKLVNVSLGNKLTYIGYGVFSGCRELSSINIPDSVKGIGTSAFYLCINLKNIVLGSGVTGIGQYAFQDCSSLNSISIPNGIKIIESGAFIGCNSLRDAYYDGTKEEWKSVEVGSDNDPLLKALRIKHTELTPKNGETNVHFDKNGNLTVSFTVTGIAKKDSGIIKLYSYSTDQLLYSVNVNDTGVNVDTRDFPGGLYGTKVSIITIPLKNFIYNTKVYIIIDAGSFTVDGREFKDIRTKNDWTFTTTKYMFAYGKDTFKFINSKPDLGISKEDTSLDVNWDIINNELDKFTTPERARMRNEINNNGGCCFGFSVLALMDYSGMNGEINKALNAQNIHDWSRAADNINVCTYLARAQMKMQSTIYLQAKYSYMILNSERERIRQLHEYVKASQERKSPPVCVDYAFRDGDEIPGHTVIAYGVEDGDFNINGNSFQHKILTIDPNYLYINEDTQDDCPCIYISEDYSRYCIIGGGAIADGTQRTYFGGGDYLSDNIWRDGRCIIQYISNDLSILNPQDSTDVNIVVVDFGTTYSFVLNGHVISFNEAANGSSEYRFLVNPESVDSSKYSLVLPEQDKYDISVPDNGEKTGFSVSNNKSYVKVAGSGSYDISIDNTMENMTMSFNEAYEVTFASDTIKNAYHHSNVKIASGDKSSCKMTVIDEGIVIDTDNDKQVFTVTLGDLSEVEQYDVICDQRKTLIKILDGEAFAYIDRDSDGHYETKRDDISYTSGEDFSYNELSETDENGNPLICVTQYWGNSKVVKIPSVIDGKTVVGVSRSTFSSESDIKDIIEEVYLPDSLDRLEVEAFYGCKNLRKIYLGSLKKGISIRPWMDMGLEWALHDCPNLEEISMSNNADFPLKEIGDNAFGDGNNPMFYSDLLSHLKRITIGDSMTNVSEIIFYGDALEYVKIGKNNPVYKSINGIVYTKDGKTMLCCGSSYKGENIVIPDGVISIQNDGFSNCKYIKTITFPESVNTMYAGLHGMPNLERIILKGPVAVGLEDDLARTIRSFIIVYPSKYYNQYSRLFNKYKNVTWIPDKKTLFKDVTDSSLFYYDPVYWAVDNGITTGFNDNTFRPNTNCNRAAVVTFLWRLAGKPNRGITNAFSDMTGNDEFDRAITWALKTGITTGFKDGTFRPWMTCNRAAIVTFLWRYAGKPIPVSAAKFSDMTDNDDFNKAISWAAENDITTGYNDKTFRPWNQCLRLAVASFLYRYAHL